MREGLILPLNEQAIVATLDRADGQTGLLIVTGGRQTRIGPHRMMACLARDIAAAGHPVLRYDRRGTGDSDGSDQGFRGCAQDIEAAAKALRNAVPSINTLYGLGLCDGATALALYGRKAELDGLILLNPWVIETDAQTLPRAAIRAHYRDRVLTAAGWQTLLRRGFNMAAFARGFVKAFSKEDQTLAFDAMTALADFSKPIAALLATRDATARAFIDQYETHSGKALRESGNMTVLQRDSASHSFSSTHDQKWLLSTVLAILEKANHALPDQT